MRLTRSLTILLMPVISIYGQAVLTTTAGTGTCGYLGDGSAANLATVCNPQSVIADASGNTYFYDAGNFVIRKISAWPNGIITTIAGNGVQGVTGDGGPPLAASLGLVTQMAIDSNTNRLCFGDMMAHKIRCLDLGNPTVLKGMVRGTR